jgi:hypothetical protein
VLFRSVARVTARLEQLLDAGCQSGDARDCASLARRKAPRP